jgi:hypothetical protein
MCTCLPTHLPTVQADAGHHEAIIMCAMRRVSDTAFEVLQLGTGPALCSGSSKNYGPILATCRQLGQDENVFGG